MILCLQASIFPSGKGDEIPASLGLRESPGMSVTGNVSFHRLFVSVAL